MIVNILLVLLILLSIASGVAKVMLVPQDLALFTAAGFSETGLIAYGVSQIVGGLLLIAPKTRLIGAIFLAFNFLVSTVVIYQSGNMGFAMFSLTPVVMAIVIAFDRIASKTSS